jgi:hypothetical protein
MSVRLSVRMEQLEGLYWTDCSEIWYMRIFRKYLEKIQNSLKSEKNNGTVHEDRHTFSIISRSVLLIMKNVSDKSCRESRNTHCVINEFFFLQKWCRLWDNVEKYCRAGQATDGNMVHAHCMLDTWGYKYTPSECVMLIAFPLQQRLHERPSMLRYTYVDCLCYEIRPLTADSISWTQGAVKLQSVWNLLSIWFPYLQV